MRLKVKILVSQPLDNGFYMESDSSNNRWIQFKYEHLSYFCYDCGRLGHTSHSCTYRSHKQKSQSKRPPLQSSPRATRSDSRETTSTWSASKEARELPESTKHIQQGNSLSPSSNVTSAPRWPKHYSPGKPRSCDRLLEPLKITIPEIPDCPFPGVSSVVDPFVSRQPTFIFSTGPINLEPKPKKPTTSKPKRKKPL